jgi:hypothetical protein
MTEQEMIDSMNERLDRIEARLNDINDMCTMIVDEIDKHKSTSRTITTMYDGEIMTRYYKQNKNK